MERSPVWFKRCQWKILPLIPTWSLCLACLVWLVDDKTCFFTLSVLDSCISCNVSISQRDNTACFVSGSGLRSVINFKSRVYFGKKTKKNNLDHPKHSLPSTFGPHCPWGRTVTAVCHFCPCCESFYTAVTHCCSFCRQRVFQVDSWSLKFLSKQTRACVITKRHTHKCGKQLKGSECKECPVVERQ